MNKLKNMENNTSNYEEQLKIHEDEIKFIEKLYEISEIDFHESLTPLHYIIAMKKYVEHKIEKTQFDLCFKMFHGGIELGKKIALDVNGELKSPKKGTAITEALEFNKLYDEFIKEKIQ